MPARRCRSAPAVPSTRLRSAAQGTIAGGTISDAGNGILFKDGTLNGVANAITYEGAMNVTVTSGSTLRDHHRQHVGERRFDLSDGDGRRGALATGTINIGTNNDVYFFDSQTFGATSFVTIDLEGNNATLGADPSVGTAGTLVLGADVTVEQTLGAIGYLSNGSSTHAARPHQ